MEKELKTYPGHAANIVALGMIIEMPQSERSQIIKEFLRWLDAKSKTDGATIHECVKILQTEICEMGATTGRCKKYIESCKDVGFVSVNRLKLKVTSEGKNWLQRKV